MHFEDAGTPLRAEVEGADSIDNARPPSQTSRSSLYDSKLLQLVFFSFNYPFNH